MPHKERMNRAAAGDASGKSTRTPQSRAAEDEQGDPDAPVSVEKQNSIRPARIRRRAAGPTVGGQTELAPPKTPEGERHAAPPLATSAENADPGPRTVPQVIRDRFIQDAHRFYFRDGRLAFHDHGRQLSTASENIEVITCLIEIAHSRGWQEIALEGTTGFRRQAWRRGRRVGLAVRGYKPSATEHAALIRDLSEKVEIEIADTRNSSAAAPTAPVASAAVQGVARPRKDTEELIAGKLLAHGLEAYRSDPRNEMSYFVRIDTSHGQRTIWGKDLQRAIENSLTQPKIGDQIAIRRAGRAPEGRVPQERDPAARRHGWVIEKQDFFEARAHAALTLRNPAIEPRDGVRLHPELVGPYFTIRAAELTARQMQDPVARARFVERVRNTLADSIARGDPVQPVRLRARPSGPSGLVREQAPARR